MAVHFVDIFNIPPFGGDGNVNLNNQTLDAKGLVQVSGIWTGCKAPHR